MRIYFKIWAFLAISLLALNSCKEDKLTEPAIANDNVYAALKQQADLSLTLEAINMAGLQDNFRTDNITLFAPTDSAFTSYLQALGVDSLSGMYMLYGHEAFRNAILYHLLEKKLKGMDVVNSYVLTGAKNANNQYLHAYINVINKNISLNAFAASVVQRDIEVGGSVIHKIDGVLTPLTLNGLIRVNPNFSKLKSAISKSQDNLETILNQENQFHTIFGPDDAAMSTFLTGKGYTDWSDFTYTNGNYTLSSLLRYHILSGEIHAQELRSDVYSTLLVNHNIEVVKDPSGTINIMDEKGTAPIAGVKTTDINAINGTIHIINKVLEHN